jgi:hypothetical protein
MGKLGYDDCRNPGCAVTLGLFKGRDRLRLLTNRALSLHMQ